MQKNINWQQCKDAEQCAKKLGEKVDSYLEKNKDYNILFFLSGGSAFTLLDYISIENLKSVTVAMLDERFDVSNQSNNFSQLMETLWFQKASNNGCKFISTIAEQEDTFETLAIEFEYRLQQWQQENKNGKMIGIFGMGSDGHTAGIFPFPEDIEKFTQLFDGQKNVIAYDATGKNPFTQRITTTFNLHRKFDACFAYICGEEKRKALEEFALNKLQKAQLPINILHELSQVELVTDINISQ
jgi:6-phosphogluconolactonase/glucosamine-6-phosphate isomerase/deaminase